MRFIVFIGLAIMFVSCKNEHANEDMINLEEKLSGKWIAKAFDGELHETWKLNKDGWMLQEGFYIEEKDTSYSAQTKIEKVNNELILFSVIKSSSPKIFQASQESLDKIVFENRDYRNPYEVIYEFIDKENYRRTIRGLENDSIVTYVFNFKKQ